LSPARDCARAHVTACLCQSANEPAGKWADDAGHETPSVLESKGGFAEGCAGIAHPSAADTAGDVGMRQTGACRKDYQCSSLSICSA
jgi:hypothetical protein